MKIAQTSDSSDHDETFEDLEIHRLLKSKLTDFGFMSDVKTLEERQMRVSSLNVTLFRPANSEPFSGVVL